MTPLARERFAQQAQGTRLAQRRVYFTQIPTEADCASASRLLNSCLAHELTGEVDPSPSCFQHLRVEQRLVREKHVRAAIAFRSDERDAHASSVLKKAQSYRSYISG